MRIIASLTLFAVLAAAADKHVMVYQEAGRFGGWPANHGVWSWGNEIVVGFSAAYFAVKEANRHQYDNTKPEEPRLARSLDGGETWTIEAPKSLLPPEQGGAAVTELKEPMDFTAPNFAMTLRLSDVNKGSSRFWYTMDRGHMWRGPYSLPMFGQPGVLARTDYIVNGKRDAFVFLTVTKTNGKEGRVICARTQDGGLTWKLVSYLGDEPAGFSIMPSSIRLSPTKLLTATRVKESEKVNWIDLYSSSDNGAHWTLAVHKLTDTGGGSGNPPYLLRLKDGRICLTYGNRNAPFAINARISSDEGATWSEPRILQQGAAAWDVGYVRSALRPDGKVVTAYYYNNDPHKERYIEATIWDPKQ